MNRRDFVRLALIVGCSSTLGNIAYASFGAVRIRRTAMSRGIEQ